MDPVQPAAQVGSACELPPSLAPRPLPAQRCPSRTNPAEVRGARGGAALHTPRPKRRSGRERSELPRRAARSRPRSARAPLPLRSVLKQPFPRAGQQGRAAQPRCGRAPHPPGSPRPRARLRPAAPPPPLAAPDRTGPGCPSRGRPSGQVRSGRVGSIPQERLSPPRAPRNDPTPCTAALGFLIPAVPLQIVLRIFIPPPRCLLPASRSLCSNPEQLYLCYPAGVTHPGQGHPDSGAANYGQEEEQGEADSSHTC